MNNTIRGVRIAAAALTIGAATVIAGAAPAGADTAPGNPDAALYEGGTLDLSESWGGAGACVELATTTECFDTEAELLAAHPELQSFAMPAKAGRRARGRRARGRLLELAAAVRRRQLHGERAVPDHATAGAQPVVVRVRQRHQQLQGGCLRHELLLAGQRGRRLVQPRRVQPVGIDAGRVQQRPVVGLHRLTAAMWPAARAAGRRRV